MRVSSAGRFANIALAASPSLAAAADDRGFPDDHDPVIGIGRADIRCHDGVERIFYAVSFASNGLYRQT